jgi:hydroxypyruvate isomerase
MRSDSTGPVMPKFAANLMMVFAEQPGLDRSGAARVAGFQDDQYLVTHGFDRSQFAARLKQAVDTTDQVRSGNIRPQYDIYHMQIIEGDLARTITSRAARG